MTDDCKSWCGDLANSPTVPMHTDYWPSAASIMEQRAYCTPECRAHAALVHIGDVLVREGEPQDGNPYRGASLIGPERVAALTAFKHGGDTSGYSLWHAPAHGGARRITSDQVDWDSSGVP